MLNKIISFLRKYLGNPSYCTLPQPKIKRVPYEKRFKMRRRK